ncbi:ESPR domain-containing protein, partial [Burkholderia contaminans]
MNRTYRNIWNETLGTWVAASEITSARGKGSSAVSAKLLISVLL